MRNRSQLTLFITNLAILVHCTPSHSAETAKQKEAIQKVVSKGVEYLLKVHKPGADYTGGSKQMGTAALAGLALLESGVDEKNPSMQNIIKYVRAGCLQQTGTYEVSLCLMFLDRLGQPEDEPFIQMLGARLMYGQGATGGWSYQSGALLSKKEESRLRSVFVKDAKPAPEPKKDAEPKAETVRPTLHPEVGKIINRLQDPRNQIGIGGDLITDIVKDGDNSNTQFAALALSCARRHGVPMEGSAKLLRQRFRNMQLPDGGWAYIKQLDLPIAVEINSSAAMTCAGLIGLAVSSGTTEAVLRNRLDAPKPQPKKVPHNEINDAASIKAGLTVLAMFVTGQRGAEPELSVPGVLEIAPADGGDMRANLYALWSLERVAVIYGLETIGNVDWYLWGADALVRTQLPDGSWNSFFTGSEPDINASLALLFLHRTNVAKDLTAVLVGKVQDPGKAFLKNFRKDPLKKPANGADPKPVKTTKPRPDVTNPDKEYETKVARLADGMLAASGDQRKELLNALRDTKGSAYTDALARVAAKSTGAGKTEVCDALARRLMRMTAGTLREMLIDPNREIRSAAARACGLKADKQHVPDLIGLLADQESRIVTDAHVSLKSLTGQDFGPEPNAADSEKIKAILAWRNWLKMN